MASNAASPASVTATTPTDIKPILSRQPSIRMKPAMTPPGTAASPPSASHQPMSLTSKEWVIPPRPKPGRKPATDTPPTKRKAQNRAAQRAFRERRAARVGELEEQMKLLDDEHEQEQEQLRQTIEKLEREVEQYRADLVNWVDRCRRLENELSDLKSKHSTNSPRPDLADSRSRDTVVAADDNAVGCGNCTLETRCQCIDDAFNAMGGEEATHSHQHEKRPHSPVPIQSEKRVKMEPKETLEIDFTEVYSSRNNHHIARLENRSPTSAPADPCGFCSDGTPCICAEMAAEQEATASTAAVPLPRIAHPPRQLDQFTPPPSEGDVSISIPISTSSSDGCASGPGTCAQCRADPNSTLFCKSLAASRAQAAGGAPPGGCCGGGSPGGGCCQSRGRPSDQPDTVPLPARSSRSRTAATTRGLPPKAGVRLTCADAYTTLSRHPAYEQASGDIAKWLPKLHAAEATTGMIGRPALEIDAANVMAVLKDFDRRFGQSK